MTGSKSVNSSEERDTPNAHQIAAIKLACGCLAHRDGDDYVVIDGWKLGHFCSHALGDRVAEKSERLCRMANAEWDRAEREYLGQPV